MFRIGLADPLLNLSAADVARHQWKGQVFSNGQVRKQRIALEHHADATLLWRNVINGFRVDAYLPVGDGFKSCQHHHAGGLARARRAEQGDELTLLNFQI